MQLRFVRNSYIWIQSSFLWVRQRLAAHLEDTKQKNSIAALDGVRAIACLFVIWYHINLITRNMGIWNPKNSTNRLLSSIMLAGASGVTLFFVLSGFLLFMPYVKALLFENDWPSTRHFYLRRVLRIFPAYYLSLFLMIVFFQPQYLHPEHWKEVGLFLIFFMDSTQATYQKLNGPFWTLAIEWQFYMLLPLLVLGIRSIVRRVSSERRIWATTLCLLGLISWGLFSRFWGLYFSQHPSQSFLVPRQVLNVAMFFLYGFSGKYLEDFAIGMLISLYYIYALNTSTSKMKVNLQQLSPLLWGTGLLILVLLAVWHFNQWYPHSWPVFDSLIGYYYLVDEFCFSLGFGLCIVAILIDYSWLKRLFEWSPLRRIGTISYSLYMWHLPLLILLMTNGGNTLKGLNNFLASILFWVWVFALIIPFSYLLYIYVEKPGMKLGEKLRYRKRKAWFK